ncbi:MAG: peptidoglycan-associated lipoprotein Pal [Rhizomicrobium sp.]|jgi:peptidoglycan-associated lipoprotein
MLKISNALKFAALAAALALAACSTPKPKPEEAPPQAPQAATAQPSVQSSVVPGSVQDFRVNVGDTVHFEYNKSDVTDEDKGILQRQSTWLQRYPSVRVTIEGHCDERGTREYNIGLGARRANAVKEYLVSLGVSSGRVDTVSYGKERPICTESNEDCWAQNRRGVTTITGGASS